MSVSGEKCQKAKMITPEDVLNLTKFTDAYLCDLEDNIYDIQFTKFKVQDVESGAILFEIALPSDDVEDAPGDGNENSSEETRYIRYYFTPQFLQAKVLATTSEFLVGSKPLNRFRLIENHYFKDRLLKTFDLDFGSCSPLGSYSRDHLYELPNLSPELLHEIITSPFECRSDSFYFVEDRLVMHNKAEYSYSGNTQNKLC